MCPILSNEPVHIGESRDLCNGKFERERPRERLSQARAVFEAMFAKRER